jgi:hypothetical protein
MSNAERTYAVHLQGVQTMDAFAHAFNEGLIKPAGGFWNGNNWDAFNDYLSWPAEDSYVLLLEGWSECAALTGRDLTIFEEILADNQRISVHRT